MFLWFVLLILTTLFFLLGAYSYPHWVKELASSGQITLSALPQLLGMIVEIFAIVKIAAALADRKWNPTRTFIVQQINNEMQEVLYFLYKAIGAEEGRALTARQLKASARPFYDTMKSNALQDKMQALTPAMTPELLQCVASYLEQRQFTQEQFAKMPEKDLAWFFGTASIGWQQSIDDWLESPTYDVTPMPHDALYYAMMGVGLLLEICEKNPQMGWAKSDVVMDAGALHQARGIIYGRMPDLRTPEKRRADAASKGG